MSDDKKNNTSLGPDSLYEACYPHRFPFVVWRFARKDSVHPVTNLLFITLRSARTE